MAKATLGSLLASENLRKIVRFGLAGVMATLVYLILFIAIDAATGMDGTVISVLSYGIALIFSYFAQSRFTFRVARDTRAQTARFAASSLLGLAVSVGALELSKAMAWQNWVGAVIVCIAIPVLNFLMMNFWVFRPTGETNR